MGLTEAAQDVASWRIILAFFLDLITALFAFGYLVGYVFGGATPNGFALDGWRAWLVFCVDRRLFRDLRPLSRRQALAANSWRR